MRHLLELGCQAPYLRPAKSTGAGGSGASGSGLKKKHSPLHWAAYGGYLDVLCLLVKAGLNVNDCDTVGNTVLHQAATGGKIDVVKAVLSQGTDVSYCAILRGSFRFLQLLQNIPESVF